MNAETQTARLTGRASNPRASIDRGWPHPDALPASGCEQRGYWAIHEAGKTAPGVSSVPVALAWMAPLLRRVARPPKPLMRPNAVPICSASPTRCR
jgi:hypothetical protein